MRDQLLDNLGATEAGPKVGGGAEANRGIGFPRLYDLLLLILTRGRDRVYREDLLDLAGVAAGHRVLDIGCGTGTQAIAAWRRSQPGGSVVGVDISEKMLAAARRKACHAGLDLAFHHADAAELRFEDDRFDVVTITTVMHMVPQCRRRLCLRQASRVLRRGGRLLLIDYAGAPEDRRHWMAKHGLHRFFDLHSLRDPLSVVGFEEIEGGPARLAQPSLSAGNEGLIVAEARSALRAQDKSMTCGSKGPLRGPSIHHRYCSLTASTAASVPNHRRVKLHHRAREADCRSGPKNPT